MRKRERGRERNSVVETGAGKPGLGRIEVCVPVS